jgi:hypothetical protein
MRAQQDRTLAKMNDPNRQSRRHLNAALIGSLEQKYEAVMAEYCEWRKDKMDSYRLMEDRTYRQRLDRCRREIAAATAPATDVVSKMRLLDNWHETDNAESDFELETPQGSYRLSLNEVTNAWMVKTPDGALEGPFRDAQEAADWAAEDWDATFSDAASENN